MTSPSEHSEEQIELGVRKFNATLVEHSEEVIDKYIVDKTKNIVKRFMKAKHIEPIENIKRIIQESENVVSACSCDCKNYGLECLCGGRINGH